MKTVPIADATSQQLRLFALNTLGITISPSAKETTVRARVEAAWDKPDIPIGVVAPVDGESPQDLKAASDAVPQAVTDEQQPPAPGMVRLILGLTEDAGGDRPVEVGVNGKIMLIPRGEEVDIPESYFEVLEHAVTHKYDSLPDGGMNPIPRKVPLYPFQVIERIAA